MKFARQQSSLILSHSPPYIKGIDFPERHVGVLIGSSNRFAQGQAQIKICTARIMHKYWVILLFPAWFSWIQIAKILFWSDSLIHGRMSPKNAITNYFDWKPDFSLVTRDRAPFLFCLIQNVLGKFLPKTRAKFHVQAWCLCHVRVKKIWGHMTYIIVCHFCSPL